MTKRPYKQILTKFLKFGFLAWGGPVAQLYLIRDELVDKEKWISADKFKKSLAIYQLLPGPEAHEMCVHIGTMKGGRIGGIIAGLAFMAPGFFLMLLFAFLYQHFGKAQLTPLFLFVTPVITALIVRATHRLSTHMIQSFRNLIPLITAIILTLINIHFTIIFGITALFEILWAKNKKQLAIGLCSVLIAIAIFAKINFPPEKSTEITTQNNSNTAIFLSGLKGGLLSFGGAYTAIPVLEKDMIGKYNHITRETFLDSLAIGSLIPSPLIIFATFLGYMASGLTGAVLITIGIFLPAFLFSIIGFEFLEKITENKTLHSVLEGIAAAVVGLLTVAALQIFLHSIISILAAGIFIISLILFYKVKKNWITPLTIILAALTGMCCGTI